MGIFKALCETGNFVYVCYTLPLNGINITCVHAADLYQLKLDAQCDYIKYWSHQLGQEPTEYLRQLQIALEGKRGDGPNFLPPDPTQCNDMFEIKPNYILWRRVFACSKRFDMGLQLMRVDRKEAFKSIMEAVVEESKFKTNAMLDLWNEVIEARKATQEANEIMKNHNALQAKHREEVQMIKEQLAAARLECKQRKSRLNFNIKEKVLRLHVSGRSLKSISKKTGLNEKVIRKWINEHNKEDEVLDKRKTAAGSDNETNEEDTRDLKSRPKSREDVTRTREQIVQFHKEGRSASEISKLLSLSEKTIKRWVQKYESGEGLEDKPRTGRPRTTSKKEDMLMINSIINNPYIDGKALQKTLELRCHPQTVRRRLKEASFTLINHQSKKNRRWDLTNEAKPSEAEQSTNKNHKKMGTSSVDEWPLKERINTRSKKRKDVGESSRSANGVSGIEDLSADHSGIGDDSSNTADQQTAMSSAIMISKKILDDFEIPETARRSVTSLRQQPIADIVVSGTRPSVEQTDLTPVHLQSLHNPPGGSLSSSIGDHKFDLGGEAADIGMSKVPLDFEIEKDSSLSATLVDSEVLFVGKSPELDLRNMDEPF